MKHTVKRLSVRAETVRLLESSSLHAVHGGEQPRSRGECTTATTDGATGCLSEASGCASLCEWSCINQSCHLVTQP
jgi:hypothetical protein